MSEGKVWKPYNTKHIVRNIREVFRTGDISKLSKGSYEFISQHLGFIAHYDLFGFQSEYSDLLEFARALQTSEHTRDREYNLRWANALGAPDRLNQYGPQNAPYQRSKAETIRGIVVVAREAEQAILAEKAKRKAESEAAKEKREKAVIEARQTLEAELRKIGREDLISTVNNLVHAENNKALNDFVWLFKKTD